VAEIKVRQDGDQVLLLDRFGRPILPSLPWKAAQLLARALHQKSKLAEEYAKANDIIADQALLLNMGAPFGIAVNPKILHAAAEEAATLPGGIRSRAIVGAPTIIQHPQRRTNNGDDT
jgi:hypothetical protein